MRRAAEFSLAQLAKHHTVGFEGYVCGSSDFRWGAGVGSSADEEHA